MKLREIFRLYEDDGGAGTSSASVGGGAADVEPDEDDNPTAGSTKSSDIAHVAMPLFVRGKTRRQKFANQRRAVNLPGKASGVVGKGIYEGDNIVDPENVIYRLDPENPMDDSEILVLGGAGRYTLSSLRNKARREARQLSDDLAAEHGGSFRGAQQNIRQLTNTLNTIVAAYNQLSAIRKKGGRGSRGLRNEHFELVNNCLSILENYVKIVGTAAHIAEGLEIKLTEAMKNGKMDPIQASAVKGMFHLNTDPGYGFYRYSIHVAGNHGGDKVVLGPNGGPFAYAYTDEEEKMIRDAVKAITGKDPIELTGGKSEEPDFVNTKSTMPSIDWKKVK